MMKFLLRREVLTALVGFNAIGTIWGFFWYKDQLSQTPWYFWPLTPDCPLTSLCFLLFLWWVREGKRWRAGKKKNEGADWTARIVQYALEPRFAAFVEASNLQLPSVLVGVPTGIPTDPRASRVPRPSHPTRPPTTSPDHPSSQHKGRVL